MSPRPPPHATKRRRARDRGPPQTTAQLPSWPFPSRPRRRDFRLLQAVLSLSLAGSSFRNLHVAARKVKVDHSTSRGVDIDILPERMRRKLRGLSGDSAQPMFSELFDANRDGILELQELRAWGVWRSWFEYYDADGNNFLNQLEFLKFFRERESFARNVGKMLPEVRAQMHEGQQEERQEVSEPELNAALERLIASAHRKKGHLQPLGLQQKSSPEKMRSSIRRVSHPSELSPEDFWRNHVEKQVPVVIGNVESPAKNNWSAEYVKKKFGDVALKLEPLNEARGDTGAYVQERATIGELLNGQENVYGKMYAVMETTLPRALLCGSRREQVGTAKVLRRWQLREGPHYSRLENLEREEADEEGSGKNIKNRKSTTSATSGAGALPSRATRVAQSRIFEEKTEAVEKEERAATLVPHPFPLGATTNPANSLATHAPFLTHFLEKNLWLASRPTRSQLHYDKENIFFCVYAGYKEFLLYDTRRYFADSGGFPSWVRGGGYNEQENLLNSATDWVGVDVDKVDLGMYPEFENMEFALAELRPGDCLYQPFSFLHQVRSNLGRLEADKGQGQEVGGGSETAWQISASFMFSPYEVYDSAVCSAHVLPYPDIATLPSAVFDVLWYYNGQGVVPQGYPDPLEVARELHASIVETGGKLSLSAFRHHVAGTDSERLRGKRIKVGDVWKTGKELLSEYFDEFVGWFHATSGRQLGPEVNEDAIMFSATDGDVVEQVDDPSKKPKKKKNLASQETAIQSVSEILWPRVPLDWWLRYAVDIDGGLDCNKNEIWHPRSAEEVAKMEQFMELFMASAKRNAGEKDLVAELLARLNTRDKECVVEAEAVITGAVDEREKLEQGRSSDEGSPKQEEAAVEEEPEVMEDEEAENDEAETGTVDMEL